MWQAGSTPLDCRRQLVQSAETRVQSRGLSMSTRSNSSVAYLALFVTLALASGCSRAIDPLRVADAQLAVRVKSVLINDPDVGSYPIEVHVTNGVVRLSGRLDSDVQRQRALGLARSVAGVRDLESALTVQDDAGSGPTVAALPRSPPPAPQTAPDDEMREADRRLLAVGASFGRKAPIGSTLDATVHVSPLVKIGSGAGLGVTVGFDWFDADLRPSGASARAGTLKVRPVMAGVGYTVQRARASVGLSVVGGIAFNSVDPHPGDAGTDLALDAGNSLAWRSGLSVWIDLNSRLAFNVFGGYLMTRPRTTFLEGGRPVARRVRADTSLVRVGLAYKLF